MSGLRSSNDHDRYVQPNKERGGWDVVKEGHEQASAHAERKAEGSIERARPLRTKARRAADQERAWSANRQRHDQARRGRRSCPTRET